MEIPENSNLLADLANIAEFLVSDQQYRKLVNRYIDVDLAEKEETETVFDMRLKFSQGIRNILLAAIPLRQKKLQLRKFHQYSRLSVIESKLKERAQTFLDQAEQNRVSPIENSQNSDKPPQLPIRDYNFLKQAQAFMRKGQYALAIKNLATIRADLQDHPFVHDTKLVCYPQLIKETRASGDAAGFYRYSYEYYLLTSNLGAGIQVMDAAIRAKNYQEAAIIADLLLTQTNYANAYILFRSTFLADKQKNWQKVLELCDIWDKAEIEHKEKYQSFMSDFRENAKIEIIGGAEGT